MSENFVSRLLECKRSVFLALPERRRAFDVTFEERLPAEVEPVSDGLNALRADRLPMRESVSDEAWPDVAVTWI